MSRRDDAFAPPSADEPLPPARSRSSARARKPFATAGQVRALGLIFLVGFVLLVAGRLVPRRGTPTTETLVIRGLPRAIGAAPMLSLAKGRAYTVALPASADGRPTAVGDVIVSIAAPDGRHERLAARRTLDRAAGDELPAMYVAGNELHYFTLARTATLIRRIASRGDPGQTPYREPTSSASFPSRFLGTFILSPRTRPAPGEIRVHYSDRPVQTEPGRPLTLHRLPLEGGPERKVPLDTLGVPLASLYRRWTDQALYWVRSSNAGWDEVRGKGGFRYEHPMEAELIETPLDGGPARCIATGLPNPMTGISVTATEEGVFWKTPRPFPDTRQDLHFLTRDELRVGRVGTRPKPHVLRDFSSDVPPSLFRGRLYWIEPVRSEAALRPSDTSWYSAFWPRDGSLVTAAMDGSDRRLLFLGGSEPGLTLRALHRDITRDRLYLFGATPGQSRPGDAPNTSRQMPFVAAVGPVGGAPLGKRLSLPEDTWIEPRRAHGGYLYFIRAETQHDLLSTVTDLLSENAIPGPAPSLWRVPLPE